MNNLFKSRNYVASLFILLLLFIAIEPVESSQTACPTSTLADMSDVKVAVYNCSDKVHALASRIALVNMYEWMGATVDLLNASYIKNYGLEGYDIIAMPGDDPRGIGMELGTNGIKIVRNFISNGGSYFGVCGGAMFACYKGVFSGTDYYWTLMLFNGQVRGPIPGVEGMTMTTLNVNTSCTSVDLSEVPEALDVFYYGGGYYTPNEEQEMTSIAQYDEGQAAIITFQYENGCVCLSGVHPEWEENSDRDGTDYSDDHNDPDSEWDLMKQISLWQVETSTWVTPTPTESTTPTTEIPSTNTTPTTPNESPVLDPVLLSIAVAGGLGAVLVVVIFFKRR
jgi:glutamine amidotransferase-like uncharacterized protein